MTHDRNAVSPTRLDVTDLMDSPGGTREVHLDVPVPEGFEVPLTRFVGEVTVDGVLESLVDGVLLRGSVGVGLAQQCVSCLDPAPGDHAEAEVAELFSDPSTLEEPDDIDPGYEIIDNMIDIDAMLRDTLAEAVPTAPHCSPDCAGLCPTCGVNRNHTACSCADDVVDDRWSALSDLNLNT